MHHDDRDKDDPVLRAVLAQRFDRSNGRRRRIPVPSTQDSAEIDALASSSKLNQPLRTPSPRRQDDPPTVNVALPNGINSEHGSAQLPPITDFVADGPKASSSSGQRNGMSAPSIGGVNLLASAANTGAKLTSMSQGPSSNPEGEGELPKWRSPFQVPYGPAGYTSRTRQPDVAYYDPQIAISRDVSRLCSVSGNTEMAHCKFKFP